MIKINNIEYDLTEKEIEEFFEIMKYNGWWPSSIEYRFPGMNDSSFTENVTMIGNTKDWSYDDSH